MDYFEHDSLREEEIEALQTLAKSPKKNGLKQIPCAKGLPTVRERQEQ